MRGWTAVTSTMPITAVAIPEYRTLWTVGGTKLVGRSTDGGLNWTQNAVAPDALHVISAINAQQAWAAGDDGIVYRTEDGGQNWVDLATGQEGAITALRFITAKAGFLVQGERAYATTDGGSSWQALGDVGNYPSPRLLSTSPQQLLIYSRTVPQVFATYKDGVWRHDFLSYGSSPFKAMDFVSTNLVYAQTDSGLAISADAGRNWRLATGPTVSGVHTSIDQIHGLLIGPGAQLMMTVTMTGGIRTIYSSDGGQVWQNAGEQTFTDDGMGRVFDRDRAWSLTAAHGLMRLGH
jgi:photosystem II stability/assembly factor-like uncharacterized protein